MHEYIILGVRIQAYSKVLVVIQFMRLAESLQQQLTFAGYELFRMQRGTSKQFASSITALSGSVGELTEVLQSITRAFVRYVF